MSKRISFTVQGKVQGVFFRAFTEEKAKAGNLTGWVKNASDGSVVGEAQGDDGAIKTFLEHLNKGPSAARVSGVDHQEIDTKSGEGSFTEK